MVLAKRLGDQAFAEAAAAMAAATAAAGSPLDTALRTCGGDAASILASSPAASQAAEGVETPHLILVLNADMISVGMYMVEAVSEWPLA